MIINKSEVLKNIRDKEDKVVVSNTIDKYIKYEKSGISTYTNFLDPRKLSLIESILKNQKIKYNVYKPNEFLEKSIIFFGDYEYFITIFQIDGTFKHKDILGTLFSLGLDFDTIGDIIIEDDYAYITNLTRLNEVIEKNLNIINNTYIKTKKVDNMIITKDKFKELNIIVASMRLDCIVSKLGNMGRGEAQKFITDGFVLLNYKECKNIKQIVFENDVVSIRKNGKYIILNTEKKTKKDNILLNVKKYN